MTKRELLQALKGVDDDCEVTILGENDTLKRVVAVECWRPSRRGMAIVTLRPDHPRETLFGEEVRGVA